MCSDTLKIARFEFLCRFRIQRESDNYRQRTDRGGGHGSFLKDGYILRFKIRKNNSI